MATTGCDLAVVGVGSVGSAILYHAARAGMDAIGIEQFDVPNEHAGYCGRTRLHRLVYPEGRHYGRLARRAGELWRDLEGIASRRLLWPTGSLDAFAPGDPSLASVLRAAARDALPVERLDGAAASARWPGYRFPDDYDVLFQPDGGVLEAAECVRAHVRCAVAAGARLLTGTRVDGWSRRDGIEIATTTGTVRARRLAIAAGPWAGHFLPGLEGASLMVERMVMTWLPVAEGGRFDPEMFPVSNVRTRDGAKFACVPRLDGDGVKVVKDHHLGEPADPWAPDRRVRTADTAVSVRFAERFLTIDAPRPGRAQTCMYTNLPDRGFLADFADEERDVVLVSACAGHGFKFAPVMGELVVEALRAGDLPAALAPFSLARFASRPTPSVAR